jgi:hypothetical protein
MTNATKPEAGKVRFFEDSDDRGYWVGLERFDGKRWASLSPEHPTFFTIEAAKAYIRMKFGQ